jgi:hypothetical protein
MPILQDLMDWDIDTGAQHSIVGIQVTDRQNVVKMTENVDKMTENVDKMTENVNKMTENVYSPPQRLCTPQGLSVS